MIRLWASLKSFHTGSPDSQRDGEELKGRLKQKNRFLEIPFTTIAFSFLVLFTFISCTKDGHTASDPTIPSAPVIPVATDTTPPRSFLALGDSYTIGQSVPAADRFPVQAAKYLTARGTNFGPPEIIAQTGWTTANLLSSLALAAPLKPQYDIVTLLIGVNNQHQGRTQQEYADQFLTLLGMAVQYAGNNKKRVIVLSIPDYSVTPYANGSDKALIAKEIDSFNVINKTIAMKVGVFYLDITGSSRLAANDPSLIASDGLHPSGLEYKVWAEGLVPVIQKALQ
jgi:lysophospholipase L1-like esterase